MLGDPHVDRMDRSVRGRLMYTASRVPYITWNGTPVVKILNPDSTP
jgi:hypothetical protein